MTEELTVYAVKEILTTMIQSNENIQINREMQKTERARIVAQKEVLLEAVRDKHEENMFSIRCNSEDRKQLINIIGEIIKKENLCDNDVVLCQSFLSFLRADQQQTSKALSTTPVLQLN